MWRDLDFSSTRQYLGRHLPNLNGSVVWKGKELVLDVPAINDNILVKQQLVLRYPASATA